MHEAFDLCFNNTPWLPADGNHVYVHKIVPLDLAKKLGVQMILNKCLSRYERQGSKPFGQREGAVVDCKTCCAPTTFRFDASFKESWCCNSA